MENYDSESCDNEYSDQILGNPKLTDAIFRDVSTVVISSISHNGQLIYVNYPTFAPFPPGAVQSELFANNNGKLSSIKTVPIDAFASNGSVGGGNVNKSFTLFTVLDDNNINGATSIGRVRLFQINNFITPSATLLIQGIIPGGLSGGIFTDDNRFIIISYTTALDGVLHLAVLETSTLTILSVVDIQPSPVGSPPFPNNNKAVSNGPQTFQLCTKNRSKDNEDHKDNGCGCGSRHKHKNKDYDSKYRSKNYVVFGYATLFGPIGLTPSFIAPAVFQVYRISSVGQLFLIDQVNQPQFPVAYFGLSTKSGKTRILVGDRPALLLNQVTIFQNTTNIQTFIPGDNKNLKLYSFNGRNLKLKAEKGFDEGAIVSNFYPEENSDGHLFAVARSTGGQVNIPSQLGIISFFNISPGHCDNCDNDNCPRKLEINPIEDTFFTPPFASSPLFGENGKWLVVGGGNQVTQNGGAPGIFNINLYRIKKEDK